ncbi:Ig-like domain-containing protein [Polaromonas sp. P2-4]|nr:Ig-like domain-containing protein [Polaromonas sp. P2-4]
MNRVLLSGDINPAVLAINGEITAPGEQDHIAFTLRQPTRVVFDSLTNRSDISWQLDGPSGQISHQSFSSSGSVNPGTNPPIDLAAGDYSLTVDGTMDATGSYAFRLLDLSSATSIEPGTPMSGQLSPGTETDAYKFDVVEGERFFFEVESNNNADGITWCLLDPSGNQVFQSGFVGSASEYPPALIYSGTYTLLIEGAISASGTVDYSVNVQPTQEVLFHTIAPGAVLPEQALDFRATFSEALDPNYLSSSNVVLVNTVTGAQVAVNSLSYDNTTRQLHVLFPVLNEGAYQLSLLNAGFRDLAGNRLNGGADFAVSFGVDASDKGIPNAIGE